MDKTKRKYIPGFAGSPRIEKAARLLIENTTISRSAALQIAGYTKKTV